MDLEQPLVIHGLVLQGHTSRRGVLKGDAARCVFVGIRKTPEATSGVAVTSSLETARRVPVASRQAASVLPTTKRQRHAGTRRRRVLYRRERCRLVHLCRARRNMRGRNGFSCAVYRAVRSSSSGGAGTGAIRVRNLERAAVCRSLPRLSGRVVGVHGETSLAAVTAVRPAAVAVAGTRRDASRRPLCCNSPLAFLHIRASVALICGDGTRTLRARRGMGKCAGTLQLTKDRILVGEQIAH